jgi:hypothetical protein
MSIIRVDQPFLCPPSQGNSSTWFIPLFSSTVVISSILGVCAFLCEACLSFSLRRVSPIDSMLYPTEQLSQGEVS